MERKIFLILHQNNYLVNMNTIANKHEKATKALEKAMEVRCVWMQALAGKISKDELDAKGIHFMAVKK